MYVFIIHLFFHFLNSKQCVNSFGIWRNSKFKVFINDDAEKQTLDEELRDICSDFFKHCKLQIRKTHIVEEKLTRSKNLKQGGLLIRNMEDDITKSRGGTLGGFVYQNFDLSPSFPRN